MTIKKALVGISKEYGMLSVETSISYGTLYRERAVYTRLSQMKTLKRQIFFIS